MLIVIAVVLAVGGYVAYSAYQRYVVQLLTVPGCQAGTGDNAVPLDFGQAADAATVAGVAAREHLPARALTIAYATAFQESKLENLSYGDLDSVGIFQQRPSQGWGTAKQLQDPAYAAQAFFGALVKVPHYTTIPVYQAAQAVQRSADGYAYQQYADTGAQLAADFTTRPHAVTCWYSPQAQAASQNVSTKLNLNGAVTGLKDTFGEPGQWQGGDTAHLGRLGHVDDPACRPEPGLGRGELAGRQRELVRDHPGQLPRVPLDGQAERNELAGRRECERGGYCRQLAGRTTILGGSWNWVSTLKRSSQVTYTIAQSCVDVLDKACIEECPVDCIYEGERMLYIHPDECVDCGACEPVCPVEAIYYEDDVPEQWKDYTKINADFFEELGSPGGASKTGKVGKDHPTVAALPPQAAEG